MAVTGKAGGQTLDSSSHTVLAIEPDVLQTMAEKARQYVKSLTGRLLRA